MSDMREVSDEIKKIVKVSLANFFWLFPRLCRLFKHLRREMRIWKNLRHPNIIRFIGFAIENESYRPTAVLVSEWCGHGNVIEYLGQNPAADRDMLVGRR